MEIRKRWDVKRCKGNNWRDGKGNNDKYVKKNRRNVRENRKNVEKNGKDVRKEERCKEEEWE